MPNGSHKPKLRRSQQLNESFCGPAVIEMLLGNVGVFVTQSQVAKYGGALATIDEQGMNINQMAQAVTYLSNGTYFWIKEHATLSEIALLVNTYKFPVGIEWQGLFVTEEDEDDDEYDDDEDDEEDEEDDDDDEEDDDDDEEDDDEEEGDQLGVKDYGHYSIVSHVDEAKKQLIIVDPYKNFINQDRIFTFDQFLPRWWDTNVLKNPISGNEELMKDERLMFIITPRDEYFPYELGLRIITGLGTSQFFPQQRVE